MKKRLLVLSLTLLVIFAAIAWAAVNSFYWRVSTAAMDAIVSPSTGDICVVANADGFMFYRYTGADWDSITDAITTITILNPADGDDPLWFKNPKAFTVTSLNCVTLGGGDIDVDIQECDANGANCASGGIALTDVTTTNQADTSFTDAEIDANDYLKMVLTNQSGTTDQLSCILGFK